MVAVALEIPPVTGAELALELVILGVVALPLARLATDPGIRRRFQAFPRMQLAISGSLAVYLTIVISAALTTPQLVRAFAVIAVVVLAVERWQARPAFGITRGLPPGSLAFMPAAPWKNPRYYFEQIEAHGPVFKFRHFIYPAVGIAGFDKAADFLRANHESLSVPPAPFNSVVPGGFIRYLGEDRHSDISGVLRSVITPAVVEAAEESLASEVRHALARIAAGGSLPLLKEMDIMVRNVMMRCFYGVGGQLLDRLDSLYTVADYRHLASTGRDRTLEALFAIIGEVRAMAVTMDDQRLARPSFLSELVRLHPDLVTNDEVMGNFVYTLHTARLDVTGLMVWLMVKLASEPAWTEKLGRDVSEDRTAAVRSGGAADRFVRETLRMHQSEFLLRRVTKPVSWSGFTIPAGWYVRICVQESHRSAEFFDNPNAFDPDRFIRPANRTRYSPFGMAPRVCPGEQLSRVLGSQLAAGLASDYRATVSDLEPLEFSGFHWRPGPNVRVQVTPRA